MVFIFYLLFTGIWPRSHLMLSDNAVEDGACLTRNSLFILVLKTSKLCWSENTLAGRAFHSLACARIRNDEPNQSTNCILNWYIYGTAEQWLSYIAHRHLFWIWLFVNLSLIVFKCTHNIWGIPEWRNVKKNDTGKKEKAIKIFLLPR